MKSKDASKNFPGKAPPNPCRPLVTSAPEPGPTIVPRWGVLAIILVITAAAFFPVLGHGFVNWDDTEHLLDNPLVRSLEGENLARIFKTRVLQNYIPLTILSFALEYKLFGYHPFIYHLDNLVLHLVAVSLVFGFILRLGFPVLTAGGATLLFAIHPMHVESVAWVSERKDLLYTVFYLLALRQYWDYVEHRKASSYWGALGCGLLSMLAKPMAVSLPLIFFLLDWWKKRPWSMTLFMEKIPFFAYVIPLSILAVAETQNVLGVMPDLGQGLLIMVWSFIFYLWKFLFPLTLSPVYELPQPVSLGQGTYGGALLFLTIFVFHLWFFRKVRLVWFAAFFYVFSIFFLLHYNDLCLNIVNDRFMYLPSLGYCLLFAELMAQGHRRLAKDKVTRRLFGIFLFILFLGLAGKTFVQSRRWKDGGTLWRYVLALYPDHSRANNNLADFLLKSDINSDEVLRLCQKAIALDPDYADARVNLGGFLGRRQDYDGAIAQLLKAVDLEPDHAVAHVNLGTAYLQKGETQRSVFHFEKACQLGFCPPPVRSTLEQLKAQGAQGREKDQ